VVLKPETVRSRLRFLEGVVADLRALAAQPRDELLGSRARLWSVERGLQVAAEAVFDVGNHVLAGHFEDHADDYEDILKRLLSHGVISSDLAERLRGLGGFRNVLVHEYADLDPDRILEYLADAPDQFASYVAEVRLWVDRAGGSP
jgi:uncharacterized protein YutE (UPF0331/DUF86 family)